MEELKWKIVNRHSGVELGIYEGATGLDALDAMARDAGYRDYADACEVTGDTSGDLNVEQIG